MRRVSQSSPSRVLSADEMQCTLADLDAIFRDPQEAPPPQCESLESTDDSSPDAPSSVVQPRAAKQPTHAPRDVLINSLQDDSVLGLDDVPMLEPDPATMSDHELDNESD